MSMEGSSRNRFKVIEGDRESLSRQTLKAFVDGDDDAFLEGLMRMNELKRSKASLKVAGDSKDSREDWEDGTAS